MNQGFIHLDTLIAPQILRQNARGYFSPYSKMPFPVQNSFPKERWRKLGLLNLKNKFE